MRGGFPFVGVPASIVTVLGFSFFPHKVALPPEPRPRSAGMPGRSFPSLRVRADSSSAHRHPPSPHAPPLRSPVKGPSMPTKFPRSDPGFREPRPGESGPSAVPRAGMPLVEVKASSVEKTSMSQGSRLVHHLGAPGLEDRSIRAGAPRGRLRLPYAFVAKTTAAPVPRPTTPKERIPPTQNRKIPPTQYTPRPNSPQPRPQASPLPLLLDRFQKRERVFLSG